jgi:hypothetical protein
VNEYKHELFEAELRRIQPAKLPDDFAERLAAAQPGLRRSSERVARASQPAHWRTLIRWLVPTTASAAALVAFVIWLKAPERRTSPASIAATPPPLRADDVEIDRQLIGTFETIATLPSGEPIRVRCREWMDEVVLRDTARGVAIKQRTPRFEVMPVSFETF